MKLLAVEIVGFGKWQQQKITFESGNQLLYGANEVGKSTLYQFIQAMLFGFPQRAKENAITHLKMVARMVVVCGWHILCLGKFKSSVLKKNKGQAIIYYQQQMGMKTLQQMLHPLTKSYFKRFYFPTRTINYE